MIDGQTSRTMRQRSSSTDRSIRKLFWIGSLLFLPWVPIGVAAKTKRAGNGSKESVIEKVTQRSGNIDVLDLETMEYYRDGTTREPFDVVVLFYAKWCQNCRALSPIYIRIAELLSAGSRNLILGYFDCEADYEHATLCSTLGVKHYPTIHFYSLSGQHLPSPRTLPHHATEFAGNWQQGEAILDWIKCMSFLSRWHRSGWGAHLRKWLLFSGAKPSPNEESTQLPVGIPPAVALERKTASLEVDVQMNRDLALRSSSIINVMLFPVTDVMPKPLMQDNYTDFPDIFAYLFTQDRWLVQNDTPSLVLRTCTMEMVMDLCERLTNHATNEWVNNLKVTTIDEITDEQLARFTDDVMDAVHGREPFCALVEKCVIEDYMPPECRPLSCPFHDRMACRYVTACLTETMQQAYADALNVTVPLPGSYRGETSTITMGGDKRETGEKSESAKSRWGLV